VNDTGTNLYTFGSTRVRQAHRVNANPRPAYRPRTKTGRHRPSHPPVSHPSFAPSKGFSATRDWGWWARRGNASQGPANHPPGRARQRARPFFCALETSQAHPQLSRRARIFRALCCRCFGTRLRRLL